MITGLVFQYPLGFFFALITFLSDAFVAEYNTGIKYKS